MRANIDRREVTFTPAVIGTDETKALFRVTAGDRVLYCSAVMNTNAANSTTSTVSLGDGTDAAGFLTTSDIDLEASVLGVVKPGTGTYLANSGGKLYAADDTIDVTYLNGTEGATYPVVTFRVAIVREF